MPFMKNFCKSVLDFVKKQVVLVTAWILAIVSSLIMKPGLKDLVSFIDWRSLGILLSLMAVVQGFALNGFFQKVSVRITSSVNKVWQLVLALVLMCFFFSMAITNDVSLITFVPLTIMILDTAGLQDILILTVVLETIAANTGSMLTPIGNPQNLYLYNLMGLSPVAFIKIMLPYSVCSLVLLLVSVVFVRGRGEKVKVNASVKKELPVNKSRIIVFALLGILCLLSVFKVLPYYVSLAVVVIVLLFMERRALKNVDYILLLTFIGFFIFTGNMRNNPVVSSALSSIVSGREVIVGALVSQVISNVPAALLLSGFASSLEGLTVGVNIGGLGTLIASMASLISFRFYAATRNSRGGRYMAVFTAFNVLYLVILYCLYILIR